MQAPQQDLITRNFLWLMLSQYGSVFVSMFFSVYLTRLLNPADYGLVAVILFYFTLFNWGAELGWEQGLMAHTEIPLKDAAATHFFIRATLGIVPFILMGFFIPLSWLQMGVTRSLLFWLGVAYFLEKASFTYKIILERAYHLGRLGILELSATLLSFSGAVVLAWWGYGLWALVAQRVIEKGVIFVGYFWASPWKGLPRFDYRIAATFLRTFGLATWVTGVVGTVIYDFMPFLVGTMLNVSDAGFYAKAATLSTFPLVLTTVFNRLTSPLYAQNQKEMETLQHIFCSAQLIKAIVLIPGQLFLMVTASWWIPHFFGVQWVPLVGIYRIMAIYGLFRSLYEDIPNLFNYGFKKPWIFTWLQVLWAGSIVVLGPMLIYFFGVIGACWAMAVAMAVTTSSCWYQACQLLNCTVRTFVYYAKVLIDEAKRKVRTHIYGL